MAGVSYRIVTLPRDEFFGATFTWVGKEKIWITDLERTLLDAVLRPQHCGGFTEVAKAFQEAKSKANLEKLEGYAERMGRGVAFKRLGILGEWLGWPQDRLLRWKKFKSRGISLLDPLGTKSGPQISRWNLRLNFNLEGFLDKQRGA
jgi:predicted transcriptional regulator of viral defense system